jgi:hypothetical protein
MHEPGAKVVCIDDVFHPAVAVWYNQLPVAGNIYTVRDIVGGIEIGGQPTIAVYLEEIEGPLNDHGIERGFHCTRFRELDELLEADKNLNLNEMTIV